MRYGKNSTWSQTDSVRRVVSFLPIVIATQPANPTRPHFFPFISRDGNNRIWAHLRIASDVKMTIKSAVVSMFPFLVRYKVKYWSGLRCAKTCRCDGVVVNKAACTGKTVLQSSFELRRFLLFIAQLRL